MGLFPGKGAVLEASTTVEEGSFKVSFKGDHAVTIRVLT